MEATIMTTGTPMTTVDDLVLVRDPDVATVEADGEAVLLDESTDQVHLLNSSAAIVWACLDGTGTVAEIAFDLASELGAPVEQVLSDVRVIAQRFVDDGLVVESVSDKDDDAEQLDAARREACLPASPVLPEAPNH